MLRSVAVFLYAFMYQQNTINAGGRLMDLKDPLVMGILNVTPDSFYDGGAYKAVENAVAQASRMLVEGAAILDIGGMSSRPGARLISPEEEMERVVPVIEAILTKHPEAILSIDTIHSLTAKRALESGAKIVNDISGGRHDVAIIDVAVQYNAPFVCMHMQGMPQTMQKAPSYTDVVHEVLQYFVERISALRSRGVKDIILDPGFGFGKTVAHNYELLAKLEVFKILEIPILAGLSRKSMVCRVIDVSPKDALNGTTALHMLALRHGASILRVHDVAEALEVIRLNAYYDTVTQSGEAVGNRAEPR